MTNIAVIGSRNYSNYPQFRKIMIRLIQSIQDEITIISGGANGADSLAEQFANEFSYPIKIFKAEWDKYGKSAGYKRNYTIWENSSLGIAFWDGRSKGTSHSFNIARQQNKKLYIFNFSTNKWMKTIE